MPTFSGKNKQHHLTLAMSTTPKVIVCSSVAARPAAETHAILQEACRRDRATIATPIPKPASGAPVKFTVTRGPPLRNAPPPRHASPIEEPATTAAQWRRSAAERAAAVEKDSAAAIEPLRRIAGASAVKVPARRGAVAEEEDYYDLKRGAR